jgi:hypothetical protein
MRPKFIVLAVCSIAVLVGLAFVPGPAARPTITLVEHLPNSEHWRRALFVITNSSSKTFSYWGTSPTTPFYEIRVQTASGWQLLPTFRCGVGAELHSLRPHTSIQFDAYTVDDDSPFTIGINFEEGTPDEITRRYLSKYAAFSRWFRNVTHFHGFQPALTWSQPVTLQN